MDSISIANLELHGNKPLRVAAYTRISSEEEIKDNGSFVNQKKYFQKEIELHKDWINAGIYGDYGRSGTQIKGRNGFISMIKDACDGRMDYIITKSVSRFARNTADCIEVIRRLRRHDVNVYFIEQGFDTGGEYGELLLTVLAAIAEMESVSIVHNHTMIYSMMNARGTPLIKARFGYMKKGYQWIPVKEEARQIKLIYLLASKNITYSEIAACVNDYNRLQGNKRLWRDATVRSAILSEVYVGDLKTNKSCWIMTAEGKKRINNNGLVDSYYIKDHHEAIVGRKLYSLLGQRIRQKNSRLTDSLTKQIMKAGEEDMLLDEVRSYGEKILW